MSDSRPMTTLDGWWRERPLAGLLVAFLLLAGAYSVINPIHEGTDELRHYRFVRYIVENGRLPVQGAGECRTQSHHPPLIYSLGAAATFWIDTGNPVCHTPPDNPFWGYRYWDVGSDNKNMYLHPPGEDFPWSGEPLAAHIVRFINVVMGSLVVGLTYGIGRVVWPDRRELAVAGAGIVAFLPQFLYMSGTINNDVVAALGGAAVVYTAVLAAHRPHRVRANPGRWGMAAGGVYALALMSKFSLAPFGLLLAIGLTAGLWGRWDLRIWARLVGGAAVTTLLTAGWWFGRNYVLYGDPTGFEQVTVLWGARTPSESWGLVWQELPNLWSSFVGRFGFGQIPLPESVYTAAWWVTVLAAVGAVIEMWRGRSRPTARWVALGILLLTMGIATAVVIAYMLVSPAGAMGRFLFPGIAAFGLFVAWGLAGWLRWARLSTRWFGWPVAAGMGVLGIVALFGYLQPAYARPPTWTNEQIAAVHAAQGGEETGTAVIEPFVRLHAYEVDARTVTVGEMVDVTLYWEVLADPPGEYYQFVHLIDTVTGELIGQRDTHPGLGKFPTTEWEVGDRFVETVAVPVPETAYFSTAELSVGLYAPGSFRLPVAIDGEQVGDNIPLGPITIQARPGGFLNPLDANFEDRVRLVGYEYSRRTAEVGDEFTVILYWRMLADEAAVLDGLSSFAEIRRPDGEVEYRSQNGLLRRRPETGNIIVDEHTFTLDDAEDVGLFAVDIYLFDIFTEKRINIIANEGNWIDNELHLSSLFVAADTDNP